MQTAISPLSKCYFLKIEISYNARNKVCDKDIKRESEMARIHFGLSFLMSIFAYIKNGIGNFTV